VNPREISRLLLAFPLPLAPTSQHYVAADGAHPSQAVARAVEIGDSGEDLDERFLGGILRVAAGAEGATAVAQHDRPQQLEERRKRRTIAVGETHHQRAQCCRRQLAWRNGTVHDHPIRARRAPGFRD
jgi:hypothetical protein